MVFFFVCGGGGVDVYISYIYIILYMSHVVNYRVLSHVLRLHSHRVLKVLPEKR